MSIIELKDRPDIATDVKSYKVYTHFTALLTELKTRDLSPRIILFINESVTQINASSFTGTELTKAVKKAQTEILKQVEKEHKIVPKSHYRNLWMLLGFTAFGLPLGMAFGLSIGNIGLMAIGLPIGMAIGSVVGISLDKKALSEGKQLNWENKV